LGGAIVGWVEKFGFLPQKLTAKAPGKNDVTGRRSGFLFKRSLFQEHRHEHFQVVDFFLHFFLGGHRRVWTPHKTQRLALKNPLGLGSEVNDEGFFAVQPFVFRCIFGGENDNN